MNEGNQCNCSDGYWENVELTICTLCHYTCATCENGDSCLTCNETNNHRAIDTNQCPCADGYFERILGSGIAACELCHPRC